MWHVLQLSVTLVLELLAATTLWTCFTQATTAGSGATTTKSSAYRLRTSQNLCRPKCLISSSTDALNQASLCRLDKSLTDRCMLTVHRYIMNECIGDGRAVHVHAGRRCCVLLSRVHVTMSSLFYLAPVMSPLAWECPAVCCLLGRELDATQNQQLNRQFTHHSCPLVGRRCA